MISLRLLPENKRRQLGMSALLISLILASAPAFGQVPDPISSDPNDPGNTGPAPLSRDTASTPNLANVNEDADTVQYIDREAGPFNIGIDLKSGFGDNLFNSAGNKRSGYFAGFGIPAGLRLRRSRTLFDLNYRLDKSYYPQYSGVNNTSQVYTHQLERHASEHTTYYWNLAAGRVTSIGQYLPAFIPIGNTGVAQAPVSSTALSSNYNTTTLTTSLGFEHKVSERDQVLGTATGGWVEQAEQNKNAVPGQARQVLRSEVAGLDLRYEHATGPHSKIGGELTNVYIRGLAPRGHDNYTALEGSYRRNLTSHLDLRVAAGPLFSKASGDQLVHTNTFSYAASANLEYNIAHSRMAFSYARVLQLAYLQTATTANQFGVVFDRELTPTIDLTVDARYVRADSSSAILKQSQFGLTGKIDKRIAPNVLLFVSASRSQQKIPSALGNNNSFDRDDVFGGITVLFGNPIYRRGVH